MERRRSARTKTHGALATASRVEILKLLRTNADPVDVQRIATGTGLHSNTVRFHLDVLVAAGLALGRPDPRGASGRPRLVYTAMTGAPTGERAEGYQLLADILASYLAEGDDPAQVAEAAGRAFGRRNESARPFAEVSAAEAARRVAALFTELGFEPELAGEADERLILLHNCPFREVASEHPNVVCSMHLGLFKQALADLGAPAEAARLEPFVNPHLCIAHLTDPTGPAHARR